MVGPGKLLNERTMLLGPASSQPKLSKQQTESMKKQISRLQIPNGNPNLR